MMLDEIDKLGRGIQGDPSSAMLEVLDPEQNHTFRDNYLGVPFDLVGWSSSRPRTARHHPGAAAGPHGGDQPRRLHRGREARIARRYLVRRQLEANGLSRDQAEITDDALREIIRAYTREAGVRNLERELGSVLRKWRCGSPRGAPIR